MTMEALSLTRDEVNRLSEALKDETFRQLLSEYAAEISNPDNKRRYEEDIKQLEADRGMYVQFIHPEGHHVLKTSGSGGKCFINVCSDPLIDKATCEAVRDRDGKAGQNWTLPFSLTPGRPDRDAKGNACMIYDAVFHPDALHLAEINARLMKLINSTAVKGLGDSFLLNLDSSKIKLIKSKYKGVSHPAVIRKPIPGFIKQNPSGDKLSFPYPDVSSANPNQSQLSPAKTTTSLSKQPIIPHYIVKYRSVVDLQNYWYCRDSASSARPKDIIIIIDLPLLTSAHDVDVNVMKKRLVLKTQKPSYKLELLLSFPVDEDKGVAKFNKTTKQLTVTLPVIPVKNIQTPPMTRDDDDDEEERESDDKAGLASHQEKEKRCKIQHTKFNCNTQFTIDRCGQNVAKESLCSPNICHSHLMKELHKHDPSNNIMMNPTESKSESDHFHYTCVPEINMDDEENNSDVNIRPQEMFGGDTHVTPDKERVEVCYSSEGKQTTTLEAAAAFTHEPLILHDTDRIHQQYIKQLNLFPTDEEETLNSFDLTKSVSQKPKTKEELNSALNNRTDASVTLNKKIRFQSMEVYSKFSPEILKEAHSDGSEVIICEHKTSAALCFQNSLWFDLD